MSLKDYRYTLSLSLSLSLSGSHRVSKAMVFQGFKDSGDSRELSKTMKNDGFAWF